MRIPILFTAASLAAAALIPSGSQAANQTFDIRGTWAAEGKACQEASLFVEFDGRDILASAGPRGKERVAADYTTAFAGDRLVVNLTKVDTREGDAWSFVVDGSNTIRLDSAFFAPDERGGLMRLTRCARS